MMLEDSRINFLHGCWNYCLIKTDIDVMLLFKFDIKYVKLNFKTIASMKFSFDLNLILMWSRNYVLFKWNIKNSHQKNLKKFQFHEFRPIKNSLRSIEQESRIDRVNPRLCDKFLQFFDRSRIPFDQSDLPFNRSNKELRVDRVIQKLWNEFVEHFDRSRNTFDWSNELFFEISLSVKT